MPTYLNIYGLVEKRKIMYEAVELYRKTKHPIDLAEAKKVSSEYAKFIKAYCKAHPDIEETEYFSNKDLMTQDVINDIREILLGTYNWLPPFLRESTSGPRITSDGSYRVFATK